MSAPCPGCGWPAGRGHDRDCPRANAAVSYPADVRVEELVGPVVPMAAIDPSGRGWSVQGYTQHLGDLSHHVVLSLEIFRELVDASNRLGRMVRSAAVERAASNAVERFMAGEPTEPLMRDLRRALTEAPAPDENEQVVTSALDARIASLESGFATVLAAAQRSNDILERLASAAEAGDCQECGGTGFVDEQVERGGSSVATECTACKGTGDAP